ncbi:DUF6270 domain-containing protein [Gottfriedia acidiceleris]|uniref:DUF6270 domain-containing protein n=1 Tax=Gottfriedia acidiceleris TaxID=371036 RepID=UPI000B447612|nr:DUF6270 domain-containing protein [Gottfriedia acidiceleris]
MTIKIAVIGSCVSRDIFNSKFIPYHKELFEVVSTAWQTSFTSLVAKPVELSTEDLDTGGRLRDHRWNTLLRDLSKEPLKEILESMPEYIIIDFFADVNYGYVKLDQSEDHFLSNNPNGFRKTKFYKTKKCGKTYDIHKNARFLEFFYKGFGKFYQIIKEQLPETKLIINGFFEAFGYIGDEKYPVRYDIGTQQKVKENNTRYLEIYESIRKDFPDIDIIDMNQKTYFGDPNHPFGNHPYHMTKEYYNDLFNTITRHVLKHEIAKK